MTRKQMPQFRQRTISLYTDSTQDHKDTAATIIVYHVPTPPCVSCTNTISTPYPLLFAHESGAVLRYRQ